MSDCTNGGRSVYAPMRKYDHEEPIRGRFVFDKGMDRPIALSRRVGGEERRVLYVELDGARYVRQGERDWDEVDACW